MRTHIPGGKYAKILHHERLKFGNKVYHRTYDATAWTRSKAEAINEAKEIRQRGYLARAVKRPDSWTVFARRK